MNSLLSIKITVIMLHSLLLKCLIVEIKTRTQVPPNPVAFAQPVCLH